MSTNYSFFEQSLSERRTYRYRWDWKTDFPKPPAVETRFDIKKRRGGSTVVSGAHVMRPGNPVGLARVAERFDITLPVDIDDFYRRWDGGFLFLRRCYVLLSAREIIEHTQMMRQIRGELGPPELPWNLVRFCDMQNGEYLAMRLHPRTKQWQVVWASHEDSDEALIGDKPYFLPLDDDFRGCIKRICDSDGWPEDPNLSDDEQPEPPADRVA